MLVATSPPSRVRLVSFTQFRFSYLVVIMASSYPRIPDCQYPSFRPLSCKLSPDLRA